MTKHIYGDYSGDFSEFEGESDFVVHGDYVQKGVGRRNPNARQNASQPSDQGDSDRVFIFGDDVTINENTATFNIGGRVIRGDKVERKNKQDPFSF